MQELDIQHSSISMVENFARLKILSVALGARTFTSKAYPTTYSINAHDGNRDLPSPPFSFLFSKGATFRRNKKGCRRVNTRGKITLTPRDSDST